MKKYLIIIGVIFFSIQVYSQKKYFPYRVTLQDTTFNNISSLVINNNGKPIIIDFWASTCKPCIDLLDSYEQVYKEWHEKYGVKIYVISVDKGFRRKKALELIREHQWSFEFYFDKNNNLFNEISSKNAVPQTFIYDGHFNLLGKQTGVKPNFGYRIINGKISDEKVQINPKGKYSHLACDLTQYEEILEFILD